MSAVIAVPELMAETAKDLATIGSTVNAAHLAAAAPTVAVLPAAADEVSAGIAQVFSLHAQDYQSLAGQAAAFHEQFGQHLTASAASYSSAEAANVALLQPLTAIADQMGSAIGALGTNLYIWAADASIIWLHSLVPLFYNNPIAFIFNLPFIIPQVAIAFTIIYLGIALGLIPPNFLVLPVPPTTF